MQQLAVKTSLLDSSPERNKLGSATNCQPLCPKPRRLTPAAPEFLKPQGCSKYSQSNVDGRSGILNMITAKNTDGREQFCSCCCPRSCYSGSPPGRAENPLIHDVQFLHQMELVSPITRTKLSDKFGFSSAYQI